MRVTTESKIRKLSEFVWHISARDTPAPSVPPSGYAYGLYCVTRPTQPSIHPGPIDEYQFRLGRKRQVCSFR